MNNLIAGTDVTVSKYEKMRTDKRNWKYEFIYYCPDDPRVVVRQLSPIGWTWNFAHPNVILAIVGAIAAFITPPAVGWWIGVRSLWVLLAMSALGLALVVLWAHHAAKEPEA